MDVVEELSVVALSVSFFSLTDVLSSASVSEPFVEKEYYVQLFGKYVVELSQCTIQVRLNKMSPFRDIHLFIELESSWMHQ